MKDTIFDNKITLVDVFKWLILLYTGYATFTLVRGISEQDFAGRWFRPLVAILIVEGGLLFAEKLTQRAKTDTQARIAQGTNFAAILLIVFLAISQVLVEAAGHDMMSTQVTILDYTAPLYQVASVLAGAMLGLWVGFCLTMLLLYSANDPDAIFERKQKASEGKRATERNNSLDRGMTNVAPILGEIDAMKVIDAHLNDIADPALRAAARQKAMGGSPALPAPQYTPQSETASAMNYHRKPAAPVEDDDEPIPAPAPFVMRPANRIANDKGVGEGDGNFTNGRVPPYHATMRPPRKIAGGKTPRN